MKFLHRLDALERRMMLVDTTLADLRGASFLDGRERFWSGQALGDASGLSRLAPSKRGAAPASWIFHVGFCGSTLLTRMLDTSADTLCLREPQALVDLSDQMATMQARGTLNVAQVWASRAAGHYARLPEAPAHVVIKPSNWANPVLPVLAGAGLLDHAVFVTMERREWLRAVLRGGHDRLAFVARCAQHMAQATGRHVDLLEPAVRGASDPLDQAVRLAALLDHLQNALFDEADPAHRQRIDYAEIVRDSEAALRHARALLGLPAIEGEVETFDWHAKDPARRFDAAERFKEDLAVESEHSGRIDAAMNWIDDALGKPRAKRPKRSRKSTSAADMPRRVRSRIGEGDR